MNYMALAKGDERYVFVFRDDQFEEVLHALGRHASNPELSFSWYDAAVLSQRLRALRKQRAERSSRVLGGS